MTFDHKAKGIWDVKKKTFVKSKATKKRAKRFDCGTPKNDANAQYYLCSEHCGKKLGILW